jgi:signal transduction histidine kinase
MTATRLSAADLRPIDLFDDLDDAQLAEWAAVAVPRELAPGESLIEQGEESQGAFLLLEGTAQAELVTGNGVEPIDQHRAPTWIAATSALTGGPMPIRMRAATPCRVGVIAPEEFQRLALAHVPVLKRVLRQMRPVIARVTGIEQNRERLAALGTMAAGLAHELNNPAAAAQRAAAQLAEAIDVVGSTIGRFVEAGVERSDAEQLVALQAEAVARAGGRDVLDALDAADAEEELLARMEDLGVREAWQLAEPLAAAGVDAGWLERVAAAAGPATDAALAWVAATLSAHSLAGELQESTHRMSDLVAAVKSYAYVDRSETVEVDVHEGLETTLKVLGHKVKHTRIEVVREYDRTLPTLTLRAPELNQVWTNLLANAIDALGESGTITIATRRDGSCVEVDVSDDGPGVPPDARDRIFDAFFTTKEVGYGTGLGLATARRIVVDRHAGSLNLDSEPGRTTFRVRLPITPAN